MNNDKDKIKIPDDFPGQGTGDGGEDGSVNPEVEKDPEVIAEEKKLRLSQLKWKRYIVGFKGIAVGLQTFKSEAVSLVSGLGTLVVGWFQLRKWISQGRTDVKAVGRAQGRAEGRAQERAERKEDRVNAGQQRADQKTEVGTGSGYGSGTGRLGGGRREQVVVEAKRVKTPAGKMELPPPPGGEMMPPPATEIPTVHFFDPMNSMTVALPVIFIGSSVVAWIKRKKKISEQGGR